MDLTYVINLEARPDRLEQVRAELQTLGWSWERVNAVHAPLRGALGCALSHSVALRRFLASPPTARHALVLEDDVTFTRDPRPDMARFLTDYAGKGDSEEWDVLMLASNTVQEVGAPQEYLTRILDAQTTSAYAVSRRFAPTLLARFDQSARALMWSTTVEPQFCCDIAWKSLQPQSSWFCLAPKAAIQRPGYSDIEGRVTNYNV